MNSGNTARSKHLVTFALLFALSHLAFVLVAQGETILATRSLAGRTAETFRELARLPLFQAESVLFTLGLWTMVVASARARVPFALAWVAGLIVNLYVVIDQAVFRLFADHLQVSSYEGGLEGLPLLLGSFVHELGVASLVNSVLLLAWAAVFFRGLARWGDDARTAPLVAGIGILGALAVTSAIGVVEGRSSNLTQHPVVALVRALSAEHRVPRMEFVPGYAAPLLGRDDPPPAPSDELDARRQASVARDRPPNVVLLVLESMGSLQLLLPDGTFDAALTPTLQRWEEHATIFPEVYVAFPATTRSHVSMNTGTALTWSDVDLLEKPYRGFTLVGAMREAGYRTALFSAGYLDMESQGAFFRGLGYDAVREPATEPKAERRAHEVTSWGVDEDYMLGKALGWVGATPSDGKPFFLQYLSIVGHHPYEVPADHPVAWPRGESPWQDHRNTIHYMDAVIGRLIAQLDERGVLDDTIIAITGDHGQAFEEWHPGNTLHKSRLYEENVRSFLVVLDRKVAVRRLVSHRVASLTDLPTTLLSLLRSPLPANAVGRNLFAREFPAETVFFHKNATPEAWGARDGRWKFIVNQVGKRRPELYDLSRDPHEQNNVAAAHQDVVEAYDQRIASWFIDSNQRYLAGMESRAPPVDPGTLLADLVTPGPKAMTIGTLDDHDVMTETTTPRRKQRVAARLRLIPYQRPHHLRFMWTGPSGFRLRHDVNMEPGWAEYDSTPLVGMEKLETGPWRVELWDGDQRVWTRGFELVE